MFALIHPPGNSVVVRRDYFLAFQESLNRLPGFNCEVQGVFQERVNGRVEFHTYVVRE